MALGGIINSSVKKSLSLLKLSDEEIRQQISSLQKGELIIKNNEAVLLGIGKPYKKIKVSHL